MSLAVNFAKALCFSLLFGNSNAETLSRLNFLVISGSTSSVCIEQQQRLSKSTFLVIESDQAAVVRRYPDLSGCNGQPIWRNLGNMLVERRHAHTVEFTSIEIGNAKLSELIGNGPPEMSLSTVLESIRKNNIRFDAVLFQQGPGDIGQTSRAYKDDFNRLVRLFSNANVIAPWLIARHSRCGDLIGREVDDVQRLLPVDFFTRFYFAGPNINLIEDRAVSNGCDLDQIGEYRAAALWLQAYEAYRQLLGRARREALLFLFS